MITLRYGKKNRLRIVNVDSYDVVHEHDGRTTDERTETFEAGEGGGPGPQASHQLNPVPV